MQFLRQPYVLAVLTAVLTAALSAAIAAYTKPQDTDKSKVFYKTLLAGLGAGLLLAYFANRGEPVATEPFMGDAGVGGVGIGGVGVGGVGVEGAAPEFA